MSLTSFAQNMLNKLCQSGVTDRANFLKNIAVAGFALSSLAQTCALIFNDKIPKKEKRFLIPQEILDGIINCTLFWFISSKATDFGKLLVLKKKILPKSIAPIMKTFKPIGNTIGQLKEAFFNHLLKHGSKNIADAKYAIEGMGVLTGIAGAIISNNICTPLIRNKLASIWQKKELNRMNAIPNLNPNFGNIDYAKYNFDNLTPAPKLSTFKGFQRSGSLKI